jgi:hypothetical protein
LRHLLLLMLKLLLELQQELQVELPRPVKLPAPLQKRPLQLSFQILGSCAHVPVRSARDTRCTYSPRAPTLYLSHLPRAPTLYLSHLPRAPARYLFIIYQSTTHPVHERRAARPCTLHPTPHTLHLLP